MGKKRKDWRSKAEREAWDASRRRDRAQSPASSPEVARERDARARRAAQDAGGADEARQARSRPSALDGLEPERPREPVARRARARRRGAAAHARLGRGTPSPGARPRARSAFRSARPTSRSPSEERQHVVAVLPLVLALVDLDQVAKPNRRSRNARSQIRLSNGADEHRAASARRRARRRPGRRRRGPPSSTATRADRAVGDERVDVRRGPALAPPLKPAVLGDRRARSARRAP